ncbi:hypothetical protein PAECIP112173_02944 [Paenibacillus sp. JJ-100]|uniref:glycosyltransferase n=1 Tax=Paenibacillus sp. JJ-100 TaxID=2974896 RepID=UPI0022FF9167|nr:glycosyltransferase [Paenibacillus sp. JJ-100]CAI6080611.1 hypothetical protein PAECIP112173_02944 [Paenibacillus sp. JJ-100]
MQNRLLGIHMIVQNEEQRLPRCLDSLKQTGSEWFITDTGSSDRTPDIARTYGATVLHASWEDDFAKARNISLPLATTEWILCLDADEYVIEGLDELMRLLPGVHKSISRLRITIENQYGEGPEDKVLSYPVRLFRAQHGYRYTGRIHEQLIYHNNDSEICNVTPDPSTREVYVASDSPEKLITANEGSDEEPLAPLRLGHDGYLATVIAKGDKPKRNLHLIEQELADHPGQPFHLYNLGVTHCQLGNLEQATDALNESLLLAEPNAPYRATLVKDLARMLIALERYEQAGRLLATECDRYPAYADLHLIHGEILERQGMEERAYRAYARASTCESSQCEHVRDSDGRAVTKTKPVYVTEMGSGSYRASTSMARLAQKRGFVEEAVHLYELALEQLSTYRPAWVGLADALQQQGLSDEQIAERLLVQLKRSKQLKQQNQRRNGEGMNDSDEALGKEIGVQIVNALADCGAYHQALQLIRRETSNAHIPVGDRIHWLLCAGQVTDAWELAEDCWGGQNRGTNGQISDKSDATTREKNSENISANISSNTSSPLANVSGVTMDTLTTLRSEERSDWALACWASGKRLSASFLHTSPPMERDMWKVADRLLFDYTPLASGMDTISIQQDVPDQQLLQWGEAVQRVAKQVVLRAIQCGQLAIAQPLHERLARIMSAHDRTGTAIRQSYASMLYRHGYTMLAAEMLIQCMTEGELDAEGLFWLGETLYAKGHLEQALTLFEQALEREPEFNEAHAGAAVCSLHMALDMIRQERNRSPEAVAFEAQQIALEQQLRTAEGIPWRTVYRAKERRNHDAGTAASEKGSAATNLSVHDRQR